MNPFDHLEDPLGPPNRDALGTVLARAQRRRFARRATAAGATLVAVIAIAVSANAAVRGPDKVHVVGPSSTLPAPATTTTNAPATTTTTMPTTTTTPASTSTSTSSTPPADPGATWGATRLLITAHSLGRVEVGMTIAQAQAAAGYTFDNGDGAFFPKAPRPGYPYLWINPSAGCVGAEISATSPQTVVTPEGFVLGDSVQKLLAIYGSRATFVPAPSSGGISPYAGYVVHQADGDFAFQVDSSHGHVFGITGGKRGLLPSNCFG